MFACFKIEKKNEKIYSNIDDLPDIAAEQIPSLYSWN